MRRNALIWGIPATLYLIFFAWYTNLGGPLTPEEIAFYMQRVDAGDPTPERLALMRQFMESDSGDDFYMVNLIDMREVPVRVGEVGPDEFISRRHESLHGAHVPGALQSSLPSCDRRSRGGANYGSRRDRGSG